MEYICFILMMLVHSLITVAPLCTMVYDPFNLNLRDKVPSEGVLGIVAFCVIALCYLACSISYLILTLWVSMTCVRKLIARRKLRAMGLPFNRETLVDELRRRAQAFQQATAHKQGVKTADDPELTALQDDYNLLGVVLQSAGVKIPAKLRHLVAFEN